MIGGRFSAAKVDAASSAQILKAASLTSLFHARLAETPKKPMPSEEPISPQEPVEKIDTPESKD